MNNKLYHSIDEYESILDKQLEAIERKLFGISDCVNCGDLSFESMTDITTGTEDKDQFIKKLKEEA